MMEGKIHLLALALALLHVSCVLCDDSLLNKESLFNVSSTLKHSSGACTLTEEKYMPSSSIRSCLNSLGGKLEYDIEAVNFQLNADFLDSVCRQVTYNGTERQWFFDKEMTESQEDENDETSVFVYPKLCLDY